MGRFALVLVVLWALKTLIVTPRVRYSVPGLGFGLDLFGLLLIIPATYYLWKLFRYVRKRLLWKISRRLILAHIFIGAMPVFIVIAIFFSSALLVYYQLNYYLITNQIGIHLSQIHAFNLALREGLHELMKEASPPSAAAIKNELDTDSKYLLGAYPSASITLSFADPTTGRTMTYANQDSGSDRIKEYQIPRWLNDREFRDLVLDDTPPQVGPAKLFLRSLVSSDFRPDLPFSLEVSVPFDRYLLGRLKAALGQDMLLVNRVERPSSNALRPNSGVVEENVRASTFDSESPQVLTGSEWPLLLFPKSWTTGVEAESGISEILKVELSIPKLIQHLFRSESTIGKRIYFALKTIVFFFLIVVLASVVIGIVLTKSITNAVHSLDRGTEYVKRGDFSHRVIVRSDDQLGALGASFNQMTEYVQHLVKERVQKERLERELEIAKEVQERLFPSQAPQMDRMDVVGVCLPARTVSGDYYDFLPLGIHELGLAIGDICGKGISAALLMANLQATLRSNVMQLRPHDAGNGNRMVAGVVERLNSQIYNYTTANKFASFFYALYDEAQQTLTYCNAGHNPPLYFNGNGVRRLSAGGTVVGIFEDSKYDQETIHLKADDLFVAYTDGIVESINEYGEEFGENRLIQLIQENRQLSANGIKDLVVDRVLSWTFAEERDDDMTLVIARILNPKEIRRNI
jgi:sigma-B regulation protein RsbU (phosphoserine phosphatase)